MAVGSGRIKSPAIATSHGTAAMIQYKVSHSLAELADAAATKRAKAESEAEGNFVGGPGIS